MSDIFSDQSIEGQMGEPPVAGQEVTISAYDKLRQAQENAPDVEVPPVPVDNTQETSQPSQEAGARGRIERDDSPPSALGRIVERAGEGFREGMGEEALIPRKLSSHPLSAIWNPLMAAADTSLRGVIGLYHGAVYGANQGLQEAGMSKADANRLTRDLVMIADSTAIAGGVTRSLSTLEREARSSLRAAQRNADIADGKVTIGTKKQWYRNELENNREQIIADRARNLAFEKALERGDTAPAVAGAKASTEVKRLSDADARAAALRYLKEPEEILKDFPVFTEELITAENLRPLIREASEALDRFGDVRPGMTNDEIFTSFISRLSSGDIPATDFFARVDQAGIPREKVIELLGTTRSSAGRTLREFRGFKDRMRQNALEGDPDSQAFLKALADAEAAKNIPPGMVGNNMWSAFWLRAARGHRAMLVSLPRTAIRNAIESGGIRQLIHTAETAMDVGMHKIFNPGVPYKAVNAFDETGKMFSMMTKGKASQQLDELYKAFPEVQNKIYGGLEADAIVDVVRSGKAGPIDNALAGGMSAMLWMNRMQSKIVRQATFYSELNRELSKVGTSVDKMLDYRVVPAGFDRAVTKAIDHALFTDYVMPIKGKGTMESMFRSWANLMDTLNATIPFAGTVIDPFPRFLYNQAKFVGERMPTMGMRFMSERARARVANGDFSDFAKEFTGMTLFSAALAVRTGNFPGVMPGERFDEIQTGDGTIISLAPIAAFAPYLALADVAIRIGEGRLTPDTDSVADIITNVRGGFTSQSGWPAFDEAYNAIAGIDSMSSGEELAQFMGETVMQGFLRPMVLINDFRAEWEEGMDIQRTSKGHGVLGSVTKMIDPAGSTALAEQLGYPDGLPEMYTATRPGPTRTPRFALDENAEVTIGAGLFSQATGLLIRPPRNNVEKELIDLGFTSRSLSAKSGNPRFDNLVYRSQGPMLQILGDAIVSSQMYWEMTVAQRQEVMRQAITLSREPALAAAKLVAPQTAATLSISRMPRIQREAYLDTMDQFLGDHNTQYSSRDLIKGFQDSAREELERLGF